MVQHNPLHCLPTSAELPDSDDTPVDNELQDLIPHLLNWTRDRHEPLEVYRLDSGNYMPKVGEPVWIPEIGLGIGRSQGTYQGWTRELLYWYDSASINLEK